MELSFHNLEFEQEVRKRLNIFDRAITEDDALLVTELDFTSFNISFKDEDLETLYLFKNLKSLAIEMENMGAEFWKHFPKMESLFLVIWGEDVNFEDFSGMTNLNDLFISGGDYSSIKFKNLNALIPLKCSKQLTLHEFGPVNLAPLSDMKQLEDLAICYSNEVECIDTIGKMTHLKSLCLCGLLVDNLDFLDTLPDEIELELCGIEVSGEDEIDVTKWKRFINRDISEIGVKHKWWEYIDLSPLDE